MRNMDALARTCVRSLVISLAISLTIVDQTQGFTLRSQTPQDLSAEGSSRIEVQNDLKSSNDTQTTAKDENVAILPIQTKQNTLPAAMSTTVNMEAAKYSTEQTSVDNTPTEVTERLTITEVTITTEVMTTTDATTTTEVKTPLDSVTVTSVPSIKPLETTTSPAVERKDDFPPSTDTSTITEKASERSVEFDSTIWASSTEHALNTGKSTAAFAERTTEAQVQTSTTNKDNDKTTETITNIESTTAEVTTESHSTETSIPVIGFKLTPAWKKYASISRNHVDNTEKEDVPPRAKLVDSVNSHTTESRITLEKAFALSPGIESLQKLKVGLMETSNSMPTQRALGTTNVVVTETEQIPSSTITIKDNTESHLNYTETNIVGNLTEMVSKRAGFLDHNKKNSTEFPIVRTTNSRSRDMGLDGVLDEIDLQEDEEHRKSHSRLAEDALNEELLKESLMKDVKVTSTRYRLTPVAKENPPLGAITSTSTEALPVTAAVRTEQKTVDDLSVRPISHEKKNTNIYTVNPNYKPLKKIDVQPPKPFTRDPDDNSWRNESLTSLGIVFKAKNASKAFTEVLKNKTETVMNSLPEVNRTIEKYELRDRLEKIAEKRKSKKKKVDKFGNTEYTDYEENNNSGDYLTSKETPPPSSPLPETGTEVSSTTTTITPVHVSTFITNARSQVLSTEKPKKLFQDYYDATDDDDYATLPNVDIMKATIRPRVQWPVTHKILEETTSKQYLPERKPTVQYFPPLRKHSPDVSVNEYDDDFKKKMNLYKPAPHIESTKSPSVRNRNYPTESNYRTSTYNSNENRIQQPIQQVRYTPADAGVYLTKPPKPSPAASYESPDGFIIRHYKDFIDAAIRDNDYDRNAFLYTESPVTGVTASDAGKMPVKSDEYDYEQRKEILDAFVNNFNQNHEQFKVDFPVLFNSSIVHNNGQEGGKVLASSSATFKRLYKDDTATKANGFLFSSKSYDPSCANLTVELSPAYELHYYVPGQEEREESKISAQYGYRS